MLEHPFTVMSWLAMVTVGYMVLYSRENDWSGNVRNRMKKSWFRDCEMQMTSNILVEIQSDHVMMSS